MPHLTYFWHTFDILFAGVILCNLSTWSNSRKLSIYDLRPLEGIKKIFDTIFGIFRVKLGGLGIEIGKASEFLKIELYMTIPNHGPWSMDNPHG